MAEGQASRAPGALTRVTVLLLLLVAVAAVFYFKDRAGQDGAALEATVEAQSELPRLIDLGADKCIPCKMMAPVLVELRQEYAGRFEVEFIDVWKEKERVDEYEIKVIPTQIFYDAQGNELFRHEGFFSKEEILKVWADHGIQFSESSRAAAAS